MTTTADTAAARAARETLAAVDSGAPRRAAPARCPPQLAGFAEPVAANAIPRYLRGERPSPDAGD